MHAIKINRALRQAEIGSLPGSAWHMLGYVPEPLRASLTARELALMLDALWTACVDSQAIALRAACDDGAVWDARASRLREIAA